MQLFRICAEPVPGEGRIGPAWSGQCRVWKKVAGGQNGGMFGCRKGKRRVIWEADQAWEEL